MFCNLVSSSFFSSTHKRRDGIGLDRDDVRMIRVLEIEARVFSQPCLVMIASNDILSCPKFDIRLKIFVSVVLSKALP